MKIDPNITERVATLRTASEIEQERLAFKADRVNEHGARLSYMASGRGWVMCRRPGMAPFCVHEKEWADLPHYAAKL